MKQNNEVNQNYDFKLTPAYCLYNGVGVLSQNGAAIKFLLEETENQTLKDRISRAFSNYLQLINRYEDCPEKYKITPHVEFIKSSHSEIRKFVSNLYSLEMEENSLVPHLQSSHSDSSFLPSSIPLNEKKENKDAAAVLLLDTILFEARAKGATDIHIENNCVRFRINGRLKKYQVLQRTAYSELIQRIKLLSDMNVMEKHHCQDGHFSWDKNSPLFVRVSTACVVDENYLSEESVVMRLLDTKRIPLLLDNLGFDEKQLEEIYLLSQKPSGLVLVCGPTGAGKSTTVASILMQIEQESSHSKKIISLEEPPEYFLPGVSQFQINQKDGLSYDEALSHIFRQDPDVIMIGEIRDEMGANAAIRAALTGHLVFATLHTGGIGEAVLRMGNLGVSKKILASVLEGVVVQDLVFVDAKAELHADIGIPVFNFDVLIEDTLGESELDSLFCHYSNYSTVFANTLARLSLNSTSENFRRSERREKSIGRRQKRILISESKLLNKGDERKNVG